MDDLRAVRARLVAAEGDLRRAIERSLHDGVQQQLVALGVKVQLADRDHPELHAVFEELRQDVQAALDTVRKLAWDIYPALLLDHGLVPALRALRADVEADAIGRYPRDVEAAVYFSCVDVLERAPAARATIRLQANAHALGFDIRVDGVLDSPLGVADRIGAVGGEMTVTPSSIAGAIPLPPGTGRPL